MGEISRHDIYTACNCSNNVDQATIQKALTQKVYADKSSWNKFLKLLFLSLGLGFTAIGVVFFLAYNWQDLNKFVKLGMVQLLICTSVIVVLQSKPSLQVKNITLTATSLMVGALFAVFGQIYQTGANAYDFLLGWTVFITLWVLIANYAPLWLLFSVILNLTLYFYTEQVAQHWSTILLFLLFLLVNGGMLIVFKLLAQFNKTFYLANWYLNLLAIVTTYFCTATLMALRNSWDEPTLSIISILSITSFYLIGIFESVKEKSIFNIALVALSVIVGAIYYIFKDLGDSSQLLFLALFSIATFSIVIKLLLDLQKKWNRG